MRNMRAESTILDATIECSENFNGFGAGKACALGIDEAGRGPVLGPMVYACFVTLVGNENILKNIGVDDSKVLNEARREEIFDNMKKGSLSKAYIDTVGPKGPYQVMLEKKFPDTRIVVSERADSKYLVVGAASIVAKVTRDRKLRDWKFPEGDVNTPKGGYGSGYPGDPNTKKFLLETVDPVFGFPNFVRFSWKTAETILEKKAVKCKWENPECPAGGKITAFFKSCDNGKDCAQLKSPYFTERYLSSIPKCSDF